MTLNFYLTFFSKVKKCYIVLKHSTTTKSFQRYYQATARDVLNTALQPKVMVQNMKRKNYEYSKSMLSSIQEMVWTNLEINNYEYRQGHYAYQKSRSSSMKVKECGTE
jgi:hypothetical protein